MWVKHQRTHCLQVIGIPWLYGSLHELPRSGDSSFSNCKTTRGTPILPPLPSAIFLLKRRTLTRESSHCQATRLSASAVYLGISKDSPPCH